jgi:hypothetical protein
MTSQGAQTVRAELKPDWLWKCRPANRAPQPLYSGHEDFPSPEIAKTMVFAK